VRHFLLTLGLILSSHAFGQGILPKSHAVINLKDSGFEAWICLADPTGVYGYAGKPVSVFSLHAYLNQDPGANGKPVYVYDRNEGVGKDKPVGRVDADGCTQIRGNVAFGSYTPDELERGRMSPFEPIAERTYGLRIGNSSSLVVVHIIFNRNVTVGRILVDPFATLEH
jgi:hypothetical protein